jgi:nucleotide-binding universal stress UspA family protein
VGIDGSTAASAAAEHAARLVTPIDGEIVAVHVVSELTTWLSSLPEKSIQPADRELVVLMQETWTEPLRRLGARHRTRLASGEAADRLLEIADEEQAACIVVGRSGRTIHRSGLLGGTAFELVQRATRPLLLVPNDDRPGDGARLEAPRIASSTATSC